MKKFLVWIIKIYQLGLSPFLGSHCRFYPSCSHYAQQAILQKGVFSGAVISLKRIFKCNPLHPGGFDPIE